MPQFLLKLQLQTKSAYTGYRTQELMIKMCMTKRLCGKKPCILREILKYLIKTIVLNHLPAYTFETPDQISATQITFLVEELFPCIPVKPFLGGYYQLQSHWALASKTLDFSNF